MKINNKEALFMAVNFITVKIFTCSLQSMISIGKNSTWLFFSINTAFTVLMFLIVYALFKRSGGKDMFFVLPPFFRKCAGIFLAGYFLISSALMLDILIRSIIRSFMAESPAVFVAVFFVIAIVFGAKSGLKNNISLAVTVAPVLCFVIVVAVMLLPYGDFSNFFPMLGNNDFYIPALWGFNFFSDFLVFVLIMPYLEEKEKALKVGLSAILITFLTVITVILAITYTIPSEAEFFSPFYYAVTFLSGSRSSVNFVKIFKLCFLLNFFLYFSTAVSFATECLKRGFSLKYEKELIMLFVSLILVILKLDKGDNVITIYNGFMKYAFAVFPLMPILAYGFYKKGKML